MKNLTIPSWRQNGATVMLALLVGCLSSLNTHADGQLLATGGASMVEGAAGGGIVPWSVLSGYGTEDEIGLTAFATHVGVDDFKLDVVGASVTFFNRIELSYAHQDFDLGSLGDAIGQPDAALNQDVFGVKARLFGDIVYTAYPQVSAGLQYKRNTTFEIPNAVGAQRKDGVDLYLSASKLWLGSAFGRNLFTNLTVRATRANQLGLLGFGGPRRNDYELMVEGAAALLLSRQWAIGAEYRQKPNNLNFAEEDDWLDGFIAWFPNKHASVVGAYVDLGSIGGFERQRGWYLSAQFSY